MKMYKIMIVEDDSVIASEVVKRLESWGFSAFAVADLNRVTDEFTKTAPQLVLMDISLPFYNGYYWCSQIRKISKVPIIFLSSASDNMNIVMAMNMGGDDFVAKPFSMEVLLAKIQAVLRRAYDFADDAPLLSCNGAVLNTGDFSLQIDNIRIELTKNEYRIMETLMKNKGRVVSREVIMTKLWESDSFIDDNTLTVNIARLRKKLESAGLTDFIKTKKGLGYIVG